MPTYYMLSAEETSMLQLTTASQALIEAAMNAVNMQGRSYTQQGDWYSPTRIDRYNPIAGKTNTRIKRVLSIRDGVTNPDAAAAAIGANTKQALDHAGDSNVGNANFQTWSDVTVTPFNPAVYGSLESWHSGAATISPTANQFPAQFSESESMLAKWLLVAALVGVGLYVAWPVVSKVRSKVYEM